MDAVPLSKRPLAVSREETIALGVAVAAHVALVVVLAFGSPGKDVVPPPKRMTVTLAEEVADQSTSPNPFEPAAPDEAPLAGETLPEPQPVPEVAPQPQSQPQPAPAPRPVAQPQPAPRPQPAPKPVAQPPKPVARPSAQPSRSVAQPRPAASASPRNAPAGASRIGNDFLKGLPTGTRPGAQGNPAEAVSDQAKASARQSIATEVLPFWNRCVVDGADIEKLSVRIVMHLDQSGRLQSMDAPEVSGRTPANAAQVARFTECAQSAIRSASPFNLPAASYEFWKNYPVRLRKQRVN